MATGLTNKLIKQAARLDLSQIDDPIGLQTAMLDTVASGIDIHYAREVAKRCKDATHLRTLFERADRAKEY